MQTATTQQAIEKPKIQPAEIIIQRVEGTTAETRKAHRLASWHEANALLHRMSASAPKNGTYDKCDFKIVFADGTIYTGRYDLHHYSIESPRLDKHVRDFCLFMSGSKCPQHCTEHQYKMLLKTYGDEVLSAYRELLKKYALNAYDGVTVG